MTGHSDSEKTSDTKKKRGDENSQDDFLVVGIGASAGGIAALKEFFAHVPPETKMAFVVILHLSEEYESNLAQILQTKTSMKVRQVTKTVRVEPDRVYVIPPAKNLEMADGHIKLSEPERVKGKRVPIDLFFRSLADAYGKNGIAVVLSGTGSDGTLGLKRVKETGGITVAQEPAEAEYGAMPQNAINTGLVDLILPAAEIPQKLVEMRDAGERMRLPQERDEIPQTAKSTDAEALREILTIVRASTGHDFSDYKHATVLRRIARRLQVHGLTELSDYLDFLRKKEAEIGDLQQDLLITVTNFFRDREAFEFLEKEIVPKLFAGKNSSDAVRVWSVGSATGDEAYSLAILLDEYASRITNAPKIQIFASDINENAVAAARDCFYDETIAADVSPERLRRYFVREGGGWRVRKELRETILFTTHNILRDPPFSRLDLVTCRNLLIYFNRETQKKVLGIFNFALRKDGFLFLGASESAENAPGLFAVTEKKHKIYRARVTPHHQRLPDLPAPEKWNIETPPPSKPAEKEPPETLGAIHYALVEQFAPPSVLVSENFEILHVSQHAARFLRFAPGEPSRDLLENVHPSLKLDLQSALFAAQAESFVGESRNIRFNSGFGIADFGFEETDSQSAKPNRKSKSSPSKSPKSKIRNPKSNETLVNITVRLIHAPATGQAYYLVIFDESKSAAAPEEKGRIPQTVAGRDAMDNIVQRLESELKISREKLRANIEQNETSSEELKASNEELQAINEELRSASEELETSREELQSLNEELNTINAELQEKIDETLRLNSDLQNLIQSTDIGTIFLDRALRVRRYTPRIEDVLNIIPSDIGRPLEHITHKFADDHLSEDAGEVLRTLQPKEREMRGGADDRRYLVQIAPYRTVDDRIDGVVLNFLDITDIKRASDAVIESEARFRHIFFNNMVAMGIWNKQGAITNANDALLELVGGTREEIEAEKINWLEITPPEFHERDRQAVREVETSGVCEPYEKAFLHKDGREIPIVIGGGRFDERTGEGIFFAIDITERKRAEEKLRASEEKFSLFVGATSETIYEMSADWREMSFLKGREFVVSTDQPRADWTDEYIPEDEKERVWAAISKAIETKSVFELEHRVKRLDGSDGWTFSRAVPLVNSSGEIQKWFGAASDITKRKSAEEDLRESEEKYRSLFNSIDEGFCILELQFDRKGKAVDWIYLEANPAFERQTGYLNPIGKRISEFQPDLERSWFERFAEVARTGEPVRFTQYSEAMGIWYDVYAARVGDTGDNRVSLLFDDITTRIRAEEALRESEERLRLLLESAEDFAIFSFAEDGTINYWSSGAEKIFGYAETEIIGKNVNIIFTPEDLEAGVLETEMKTAMSEGRASDERWHVRRDGSLFYASGVMTLLRDGENRGFLKIARDMTERIEAEKIQRDKEMLQKLVGAQEDERRRIARDLHDELGQQLTALRMKIEAARKKCDDDDELCADINEMQVFVRKLDEGIDFLAWELRPAALDDFGLTAALAKYVREWSHYSGIKAELLESNVKNVRFAPEAETNLYRIVQESLNNIYKHAGAERVEISFDKRGDMIVLIVEDDGAGFNAADESIQDKGIGITGMKERAALIGGSFEIESVPGKRTSVFIRIPVSLTKRKKIL